MTVSKGIMWVFCIIWLILGIVVGNHLLIGMCIGVIYATLCHLERRS